MARSTYNSENIVALNVRNKSGKLIATYDVSGVGKTYDTSAVYVEGKNATKNTIVPDAQALREIGEREKAKGNNISYQTLKEIEKNKKRKKLHDTIQKLF